MKKYTFYLLLFYLLAPQPNYSQIIGPDTKWTYSNYPFIPVGPPDPLKLIGQLSVIGDTLIDSEFYYILDQNCDEVDYVRYVREEGLKTYVYFKGEKLLLYDFSLEAGDTLTVAIPYSTSEGLPDSVKVLIDSVELVNIDGQELILQHVDCYIDDYHFADWGERFLQGVGSLDWCFFPKGGIYEGGYTNLRCFENEIDVDFTLYADQYCDAYINAFPDDAQWTYRKWGDPKKLSRYEIIENVNGNFNGLNYHVLAGLDESGNPIPETFVRLQMSGLKVYWLDTLNMPHLLFDFSDDLMVSDTVTYELPPNANMYDISSNGGIEPIINPYQYVIQEITTMEPEYGEPRKIFNVLPLAREVNGEAIVNDIRQYISGVGGYKGLMRRGGAQLLGGTSERFVCYNQPGLYFPFESFLLDLNFDLSSTRDEISSNINYFPNPSSDVVYFESDTPIIEMSIHSVSGELVQVITNIKNNILDLSSLHDGVYFIKAVGNDNQLSFDKLVKY